MLQWTSDCSSDNIKFATVSELLEKIKNATSFNEKAKYFKNYLLSFRKYVSTDKEVSFFPILRLLLPHADRERSALGIHAKTISLIYIRVLSILDTSDEAMKLKGPEKFGKDLPDMIFEVMSKRGQRDQVSKMTVDEVNRILDEISLIYADTNRARLDIVFNRIITDLTALDQKWLVRIILKRLKIGLSDSKMLELFHKDGYSVYRHTSYLSKVCELPFLAHNIPTDPRKSVEIFCHVKPMLCQRVSLEKINALLARDDYYLETKMDGERFQIHIKDKEFRLFSRNGYDFTNNFTRAGQMLCASLLKAVNERGKRVDDVLLDGEMMVWDVEKQQYRQKAENIDAKSLNGKNVSLQASFCVYDLLLLNGASLLEKPYVERIRLLKTILTEKFGIVTLCKRIKVENSDHLVECINRAINANEEGVVLKREDSYYVPKSRSDGWYKIKADYIDGVCSDFDFLIIGGNYNPRRTHMQTFLVGLLGADRKQIFAIGDVASGLSIEKLKDLNESLRKHWKPIRKARIGRRIRIEQPPNMHFGSFMPDVFIMPSDSVVMEVRGSELVRSSAVHPALGYTLRFARFNAIRSDKLWQDCCTIEELQHFTMDGKKVQKVNKRQVVKDDLLANDVGKRLKFADECKSTETFEVLDDVLLNLDFCVVSVGVDPAATHQIERILKQHCARIVKNYGPKTYAVVAKKMSLRVRECLAKRICPVVDVDWVRRELESRVLTTIPPMYPSDMIGTTKAMESTLKIKFDDFGDSYSAHCTVNVLKKLLLLQTTTTPLLTRRELNAVESELVRDDKFRNIFRLISARFLVNSPHSKNKGDLHRLIFKERGGNEHKDNDDGRHSTSHCFVVASALEQKRGLLKLTADVDDKSLKYLYSDWIEESHKRNCLVASAPFEVHAFIK